MLVLNGWAENSGLEQGTEGKKKPPSGQDGGFVSPYVGLL